MIISLKIKNRKSKNILCIDAFIPSEVKFKKPKVKKKDIVPAFFSNRKLDFLIPKKQKDFIRNLNLQNLNYKKNVKV